LGLGKFALRWERPEHVRWALAPAVSMVEFLVGRPFAWDPGHGYRNLPLGILVDHSCAGSGFFLMAVTVCLWHFPWTAPHGRWLRLAAMLGTVVAMAVVVTGLRLSATLWLMEFHDVFHRHRAEVHTWVGVVFYFLSLIGVHLLARRYLSPESP